MNRKIRIWSRPAVVVVVDGSSTVSIQWPKMHFEMSAKSPDKVQVTAVISCLCVLDGWYTCYRVFGDRKLFPFCTTYQIVVASTSAIHIGDSTVRQHEISSLLIKYSEDLWPAVILAIDAIITLHHRRRHRHDKEITIWTKQQHRWLHPRSFQILLLPKGCPLCMCLLLCSNKVFDIRMSVCVVLYRWQKDLFFFIFMWPRAKNVRQEWMSACAYGQCASQLETIKKLFCDRPTNWITNVSNLI